MDLLSDRAAVVTGAATGIGFSIAAMFAQAGARVRLVDLDEGALEDAATRIRALDGQVSTSVCDVTDEAAMSDMMNDAASSFGRVDVMVNNAGITRDTSMSRMSVSDFQDVINVHLLGTWLGTRAAAQAMRENQSGSIINMSSLSGKIGNRGQTNYSAAKAGIVGLTKAAAKESARHGIRVNAIQPGLIDTRMTRAMPESVWQEKIDEIPLGRAGEPAEVAKVALFLASDLASYLTGTVIEVTGGRHM